MGDGWEHEPYVLGRADEHLGRALGLNRLNQKIACISGEGHACAEDCGGPLKMARSQEYVPKKLEVATQT